MIVYALHQFRARLARMGRRAMWPAPEDEDDAHLGVSRLLIGRAAAALFVLCGLLSLASLALPVGRGANVVGVLATGAAALVTGAAGWFLPWQAWPRAATHAIMPVAFTLIGLGIAYSGEFASAMGVFFCAAFTVVGIAHRQGTAWKFLPLFAVSFILPMWSKTGDLLLATGLAVVVGLICLIVAETLAWVTAGMRRSQVALWRAHAAVNDISADLTSLDRSSLARSAATKLSQVLDVPDVGVYSLEKDGALTLLAGVVGTEPDHAPDPHRVDLASWPAGLEAARTMEPLLGAERTALTIPLVSRARVIGLVEMLEKREGRIISPEKIAMACSVCLLIALSIQDAENLAAEQKLAGRLSSMLESSRAVASTDTVEGALSIVTERAAEALAVSECVAYEYVPESNAIVARAMWEKSPTGWNRLGEILPLEGYAAEAAILASGRPLLERISDPGLDPASRDIMESWGEKTCLTIPMASCDGPMGLLVFWDSERERDFSEDEMALANGLAEVAGESVRSAKLLRSLQRLSRTDALTGLANHRQIHEMLMRERARAARRGTCISLVMLDIDGFKLLNDTYGHPFGDTALRHVATVLEENTRGTDIVGRDGGDEFVLILSETPASEAALVVEKLREALSETPLLTPKGGSIPIHASFGVATYPEDGREVDELIVAADARLYVSKRRGGNVITAGSRDLDPIQEGDANSFSLLESMVAAVDNKDSYTRRHSDEVTEYALALAEALGLSGSSLKVVRVAGLLHDVGKIGIPDRILRKPGHLTAAEYAIVKSHSLMGEALIRAMPDLGEIRAAVLSHHERYDGTGYPQGLANTHIPLLGRVLCVADAFSAMTTDRPYRKALSREEAIAELKAGAGTQFDPGIVATFVQCLGAAAPRLPQTASG